MAVIDRINRRGNTSKKVLVGPAELSGPASDGIKGRFSSLTRVTGPVDLYEITDGSGANEGTYTIAIRPFSEYGFRASHGGVGKVALIKQPDGANTPGATSEIIALRSPRDRETSLTLGPAAIATNDRLFVVVERRDVSTLKYQLEIDLVLDAITIVTPPADDTVVSGDPATLSVVATTNDGGTLTYQWQISTDSGATFTNVANAGVYSGATTATLDISDATGLNDNQYRVIVSSNAGAPSATSSAATLTVVII